MIIDSPHFKGEYRIHYNENNYIAQKASIIKESKVPELIGTIKWISVGFYPNPLAATKKIVDMLIQDSTKDKGTILLSEWIAEYKELVSKIKL